MPRFDTEHFGATRVHARETVLDAASGESSRAAVQQNCRLRNVARGLYAVVVVVCGRSYARMEQTQARCFARKNRTARAMRLISASVREAGSNYYPRRSGEEEPKRAAGLAARNYTVALTIISDKSDKKSKFTSQRSARHFSHARQLQRRSRDNFAWWIAIVSAIVIDNGGRRTLRRENNRPLRKSGMTKTI